MWDLETLRYLNEQSHLGTVKIVNGRAGEPAEPTPEPVFPLSILAYKLVTGPPSLSRLIALLDDSDSMAFFLELVRDYLPRYEDEIMAQVEDLERIQVFCRRFSDQYFPLQSVYDFYDDFTISDFVRQIPVDLMGFSYDDYEYFNDFREGFILLLSIVESPFYDEQRIALLDKVKELVGDRLTAMIPTEGWELDEIHGMLDDTPYDGCCAFADWIHSCTGCWQLDANFAEYGPEEWSSHIVNGLTEQWPRVTELTDKMMNMYVWLEEDMQKNFEELLAKMLGDAYEPLPLPPKEQMTLPLDSDAQVIV